jgi:hypothetical protein
MALAIRRTESVRLLWTCSEVQPNEAGALAAVVQALTKGDAASRQERFRWIVTEGERAAVQPGELGRLRRGPCDLGKLGRQQPAGSSRSAAS